ncbi:hypothetical protein AB0I06_05550 [Streptomyces sp. NPDC050674]|uniref:hypothetical protein n=1 Tax=Streptomyces sp. NPDC050674 TaxID=3157216 RepID=UPI00341AD57B
MTEAIEAIRVHPRDRVLEAIGYLADSQGGDWTPPKLPAEVDELVQEMAEQPYAHLAEIEAVARVALTLASLDSDLSADVAAAIDGTGRKQVILGGAEIVTLATLAVVALYIVLTKGKAATHTSVRIEVDGEHTSIVLDQQVKYGLPAQVAGLARNAMQNGPAPSPVNGPDAVVDPQGGSTSAPL